MSEKNNGLDTTKIGTITINRKFVDKPAILMASIRLLGETNCRNIDGLYSSNKGELPSFLL